MITNTLSLKAAFAPVKGLGAAGLEDIISAESVTLVTETIRVHLIFNLSSIPWILYVSSSYAPVCSSLTAVSLETHMAREVCLPSLLQGNLSSIAFALS